MIISHGPFIVDTDKVEHYDCRNKQIRFVLKHGEVVMDFHNDSIFRWVYDELIDKIKNCAFAFDIDEFLTNKHLATMYNSITKDLKPRTE